MMKIALACDHAGYDLKLKIIKHLEQKGFTVEDYGTNSTDSCDYPDYAHPMASAVENKGFDFGIAICGSGNGISMTANKHQSIRAALCWRVDIAELARQHNNANVCSLPSRFISDDEAVAIVNAFLNTEFEGGRHQPRIDKIPIK